MNTNKTPSLSDLEWIEKFYRDLESGFDKYVRPSDYIERAMRVLYAKPRQSVQVRDNRLWRARTERWE